MTDAQIRPDKVTKPIQLLAAWLVGLIVVNASFLLGAQQITNPPWASSLLVVAAVANVPIFIIALFLLQTKFRPQMQEDSFYAQYLKTEREYSQMPPTQSLPVDVVEQSIAKTAEKITLKLGAAAKGQEQPIVNILRESQFESLVTRFGDSRSLSELFLSPETWTKIVKEWAEHEVFVQDIEALITEGLVAKKYKGYLNCFITDSGKQIASIAQDRGLLWSQTHRDFWEHERTKLACEA
ncbi:hypothetical protein ACO0LL_18795 [Undibacterium sp. TC4M20W]|uniref:hypothetical protein n=1 Tax=unclassified Undibacterium TaxID=2630295 RepID=UPI003BF31A13